MSSVENDEHGQGLSSENTVLNRALPAVDPCRRQWLAFQSVFSQVHGKEADCTNINGPYRGTLDYIFVAGAIETRTAQICRHRYGGDYKRENELYPNSDWPSDHFMICADVVLSTKRNGRAWLPRTLSTNSNGGQRYRPMIGQKLKTNLFFYNLSIIYGRKFLPIALLNFKTFCK